MRKRRLSYAFKVVIIISCLIGILSTILKASSLISILSFYTIQSNLAVLGFYVITLVISMIKPNWQKKNLYYFIRGAVIMCIFLTFAIYSISLRPLDFAMDMYPSTNIFRFSNLFVHFITPILVFCDYIIFDEKDHFDIYYPILWCCFPFIYVAYVYIYSYLGGVFFGTGGSKKYAYFFLDIDKIGIAGVFKYLLLLSIFFISFSYLLVLIDKILKRK